MWSVKQDCSKAKEADSRRAQREKAKAEAKSGALRFCSKCVVGPSRKRRREERKRGAEAGYGASGGGGGGGGGGTSSNLNQTTAKRAVLMYRGQPRCKDCLLNSVEHSFKVVLRKRAMVDRGAVIVAALSGGPCSTAMLRLLQRCILGRGRSKVLLHVFAVHIDESRLHSFFSEDARRLVTEEDACAARASLGAFARSLGFPFVSVPLEAAYDEGLVEGPYASDLLDQWRKTLSVAIESGAKAAGDGKRVLAVSAGARLDALFRALFGRKVGGGGGQAGEGQQADTSASGTRPSDPRTAAEDMARALRMQILRRVAAAVGAAVSAEQNAAKVEVGGEQQVLVHLRRVLGEAQAVPLVSLGDSADLCAARTIASIAKGNGCGLRRDVAERDLNTIRPMRDFLGREVAMYLRIIGDSGAGAPVIIPNFSTMQEGGQREETKGSINSLCRSLIADLSSTGFSGTALTVVRTTMKLDDTPIEGPLCAVCKGYLVGDTTSSSRGLCRSCALVAEEIDSGKVAPPHWELVPESIREYLIIE